MIKRRRYIEITTEEDSKGEFITGINYQPLVTEILEKTVKNMIILAKKMEVTVTANFNRTLIIVRPDDNLSNVMAEYHRNYRLSQ